MGWKSGWRMMMAVFAIAIGEVAMENVNAQEILTIQEGEPGDEVSLGVRGIAGDHLYLLYDAREGHIPLPGGDHLELEGGRYFKVVTGRTLERGTFFAKLRIPESYGGFERVYFQAVLRRNGRYHATNRVTLDLTEGWDPIDLPLRVQGQPWTQVDNFPVRAIVPMARGHYQDCEQLRVVDENGYEVPSQSRAMTRWWAADNSIRHAEVVFFASLAPDQDGISERTYYLRDDRAPAEHDGFTVREDSQSIYVEGEKIALLIGKGPGAPIRQIWTDSNGDGEFEGSEERLQSESTSLLIDRQGTPIDEHTRDETHVEIESIGPLEIVIRSGAKTKYPSGESMEHGFARRIRLFVNQPFMQVDYQLQNSATEERWSDPFYFHGYLNRFPFNFPGTITARTALDNGARTLDTPVDPEVSLAQVGANTARVYGQNFQDLLQGSNADGFLDLSSDQFGVTVFGRYFREHFPTGVRSESSGLVSLQTFPEWGDRKYEGQSTDVYWLDDMQHVRKSWTLEFHDGSRSLAEASRRSKVFQWPPVVALKTIDHYRAKATLGYGGNMPSIVSSERQPPEPPDYGNFNLGWDEFGADPDRRRSCNQGGQPKSALPFLTTQNPRDFYKAEIITMGDTQVRGQSMAPPWLDGYNHNRDGARLEMTEAPYCGGSWRAYDGYEGRRHRQGYTYPGTGFTGWLTRDAQHFWTYPVFEYYTISGDPWVRDFIESTGEFLKTYAARQDYQNPRALGHILKNMMYVYETTGDPEILTHAINYVGWIRFQQDTLGGFHCNHVFQSGYIGHALADFLDVTQWSHPQAYAAGYALLISMSQWNANFPNAQFSYGCRDASSGTGFTQLDPQSLAFLMSGQPQLLQHLNRYINQGINGGTQPYGDQMDWRGSFDGRLLQFARAGFSFDRVPTPPPADFSGVRGNNGITFSWRTPNRRDACRFFVVTSRVPISENWTDDSQRRNWWKAHMHGVNLMPEPNANQSVFCQVDSEEIYAAMFILDIYGNLSQMSPCIQIP